VLTALSHDREPRGAMRNHKRHLALEGPNVIP
jgi:hypothetical protein